MNWKYLKIGVLVVAVAVMSMGMTIIINGVPWETFDRLLVKSGISMARTSVEKTSDATLTELECLGTVITNQGASGEVDLVLYALSKRSMVTFIVEETQVIEVNPPSGEAFDLDGTALDANDVVDSDTTVGSKLVATRMKNASGTWIWSLDTVRGGWVDSGASD